MDTSMIATLIGLVGGGAVGALGFILTGIRAEQRTNGEHLKVHGEPLGGIDERTKAQSERLGGFEERFGRFEERSKADSECLIRLDERTKIHGERLAEIDECTKANSQRLIRLEERFGGLEERTISEFGQIKDVLVRIEATQAEQGRQIEKLTGGDLP